MPTFTSKDLWCMCMYICICMQTITLVQFSIWKFKNQFKNYLLIDNSATKIYYNKNDKLTKWKNIKEKFYIFPQNAYTWQDENTQGKITEFFTYFLSTNYFCFQMLFLLIFFFFLNDPVFHKIISTNNVNCFL